MSFYIYVFLQLLSSLPRAAFWLIPSFTTSPRAEQAMAAILHHKNKNNKKNQIIMMIVSC